MRLGAVALVLAACAPRATPEPRAAPLPVVDLHVDTLFQIHFAGRELDESQLSLDPPPEGVVLSLFLPEALRPAPPPGQLLPDLLDAAAELRARVPATTWLSYEGAPPDEEAIGVLLDAGVVIVGLAHGWHSAFADSATDPHPPRDGLTDAGERAVRAVQDAGAVIDVAHLSPAAFADVATIAAERCAPLIATHSAARAVHDHRRALDDDQLRAVAASDGLVGILVDRRILGGDDLDAVAAHVAHAVGIAGIEHVAIGSDLDGGVRPVDGIASTADLPALFGPLARAGLDDDAIAAVLAGNARRFLGRLPGRWACGGGPVSGSPRRRP